MHALSTFLISSFLILCPGFSSNLLLGNEPLMICGKKSKLNRPEGVAFSPDGKYVAIANSFANSILFFTLDNLDTPCYILTCSTVQLDYPHDLSFSPNGAHLAVANRKNNTVVIFKKKERELHFDLLQVIKDSSFDGIGAVAYSPTEQLLAVAETNGNRALIFAYNKDKYETTPRCILTSSNLSIPDGVAFSPDGNILGITSHKNHKIIFFERNFDTHFDFFPLPVSVIEGTQAQLTYPHSIAFHPTYDYIVTSSAGGLKDITLYQKDAQKKHAYSCLPANSYQFMPDEEKQLIHKDFPEECGAKGVAFSPDGTILGICLPSMVGEDKVLFFKDKRMMPERMDND